MAGVLARFVIILIFTIIEQYDDTINGNQGNIMVGRLAGNDVGFATNRTKRKKI